ncbi:MAG: hypothetical protein OEV66_09365, partial [Spirochaetia bacterium]|nr:hypothetical protein [Spirochaetia bacterium]
MSIQMPINYGKTWKIILSIFYILLMASGARCTGSFNITAIFKGDASLKINPKELSITEGGAPGQISISLASKPSDPVVMSFSVDNPAAARIFPQ